MEPQGAAYGFTGCVRKEVLTLMKQLGNLAIVCAQRKDVTLRIEQGRVLVMLDGTYAPTAFSADWEDDGEISELLHKTSTSFLTRPAKPLAAPCGSTGQQTFSLLS